MPAPAPAPAPVANVPPPAAEPATPKAPTCEAKGAKLAEVDTIKAGTPQQKATTIIFENGAWSATDTRPDVKAGSGCVPEADMTSLRELLAKATWKVTTAKIHCMAVSLVHTEYTVKDKLVWTARLCSGQTLDKDSEAAIQQLDKTVADVDPSRPKLN